jgi:hypothetical protein
MTTGGHMSIVTCQYCSAPIDSDIDLECFAPDDSAVCAKCRGDLDAGIGYAMRQLYRPEWDAMERERKLKIAAHQLMAMYGPESGVMPRASGDLLLLGAVAALDQESEACLKK